MALRLHHRAARDRALSGKPEIMDCLVFVVGQAVVMREFGRDFAGALTVSRLFTHGDKPMKLNAMPRREQTVQHLLVHCMVEAEAGCDGAVGPCDRTLVE